MEINIINIIVGILIIVLNTFSIISKKPRLILITAIISVLLVVLLVLIK